MKVWIEGEYVIEEEDHESYALYLEEFTRSGYPDPEEAALTQSVQDALGRSGISIRSVRVI